MKHPVNYIFILLLLPAVTSCVDESSTVGSKWVDSSLRNVLTDTCTVQLSTILADSITTSGDSICQIGHYADPYRGSLKGALFTEYNVTSSSFDEAITYVFDSITIAFRPTGDYLGDTLSTRQQIHLHRVTENIELIDNRYLYNTSSVKYEETPLTSFSFRPRPQSKEVLEVRLPDTFGREFFDLLVKQSMFFDTQDHFRQYFPGIAFLPDDNDNCITAFAVNDSSMCITMYYRKVEEAEKALTLTFTPNSTFRFNKASQDFTNTPFQDIQSGTNNALSSAQSENIAYLQGLTGVYTKIEFPYLNNLQQEGELVTIESAVLYLYPAQEAYNDFTPLPESLTLYTVNINDATEGTITDSSGETVQDGSLVKDDAQNLKPYYSFDITSFMQSNLGTFGIYRQNLMLMFPDERFLTSMDGLILGDVNHPDNQVKIEILYKAYHK